MGEFDKELRDVLLGEGYYNGRKADALKQEQIGKLDRKLRLATRLTYATLAACVAFGVFSYFQFSRAAEVRSMIGYAVLMLIMYESTVLMKLWYWIVHTRVNVQKDLKEVQLQFAELALAVRARQDGAAPDLAEPGDDAS